MDNFEYFAGMFAKKNTSCEVKRIIKPFLLSLGCILLYSFSTLGQLNHIHSFKDYNPSTGRILFDSLQTKYIIIDSIVISGNKKTKDRIIRREVDFIDGDTIFAYNIENDLLWIKNRIFNLFLFHYVDLTLTGPDSIEKHLHIVVKERLNISILPEGGLADRNFNEWWVTRNHDISRVYGGINVKLKNVWGLSHLFKFRAYAGFNEKIETSYFIPYLNKRLKTGLQVNALVEFNPQVAIQSIDHKLSYREFKSRGREKFSIGFLFIRRNEFYSQHQFGPYFQYASISDSIAILNPNYFLNGANTQKDFGLKYIYSLDKRDFNNYPLKGHLFRMESDYQYLLTEDRSQTNLLSLKSEFTQFIPLGRRFYLAAGAMGKLSNPKQQPYFNQRGLGYAREAISGYELYVIDGQSYGLIKTNLRWKVFSIKHSINFIPHHSFKSIPISMYFKIYSDAGYVADNAYNPYNNFLSNRLLAGGGAGIDIVTYLNLVGRIEYSINQLGQTGLYLHVKSGW